VDSRRVLGRQVARRRAHRRRSPLARRRPRHSRRRAAHVLVINFDFPPTLESYRARAAVVRDGGVVYSFFSNENRRSLQVVSAIVGSAAATMPGSQRRHALPRCDAVPCAAGASASRRREANGGAPVTWTNVQSFLNSTQPRPPHAVTPPLPTSLYSPPIGGPRLRDRTAPHSHHPRRRCTCDHHHHLHCCYGASAIS
jgi:hypothetical protein